LPKCAFTNTTEFAGWKDADGNDYADEATVTPTANMTLTAQWKEPPAPVETWTVSFAPNGGNGSMSAVEVEKGQSVKLPKCAFTNTTEFAGWKDADSNEYPDEATVTPTANMTLTAQWKEPPAPVEKWTISFNANGGNGTMSAVEVEKGQSVKLPKCAFTNTTEFAGWKDADGNDYADEATVTPTANMTLTAQWKEPAPVETITVSYNAGEGSGEMQSNTATKGVAFQLPYSQFAAPADKTFKAWLAPGNVELRPGDWYVFSENVTLTAQYQTPAPSSGGGCYVATAVYGSYDCPEVWTLRRFRDQVLAKTWYGRLFIRLYYAVSPTAVKLFGNADWFQNFWRGNLDKMVSGLQEQGFESTPYNDRAW
ncbi:MAG: InlB B-repeat-containing protein, partial [Oscillibacter sp.]|nr:InlB B-repeat-containing protein [Oscillibacter sp.]